MTDSRSDMTNGPEAAAREIWDNNDIFCPEDGELDPVYDPEIDCFGHTPHFSSDHPGVQIEYLCSGPDMYIFFILECPDKNGIF